MEVLTPLSSVQPLVTAYESGAWVLWAGNHPNIYFFNAFLTNYTDPQTQKTSSFNPQIQEWAYFNYLIYHLVDARCRSDSIIVRRLPVLSRPSLW